MRSFPFLLLLAFIATCAFFAPLAEAKYVKGHAKGKEFAFITRFCFTQVPKVDKKNPSIVPTSLLDINVHKAGDGNLLALYDDGADRWAKIYHHSTTCQEKLQYADRNYTLSNNESLEVRPRDVVRPHFWYLAAIKCDGDKKVDVDYEITLENSWGDNKWIKQFSCDEVGLEGLYIFYFVFYLIFCLVHAYAVYSLVRSESYHSIVKLLTASTALQSLSVFCYFIHYAVYQRNGVGAPALRGLGEMLDLMCQVVLILLLTLIAKGWCISKVQLEDAKIVLGIVGALSIAYLVMFIWENAGLDPASTVYIYQTAPGIIIVVIRALAMLWFMWCIRKTYMEENHPSKRQFYLWFAIIYTAWYIALPLITIIAAAVQPWERLKTVMIMYVTANALALSGLAFLLWPSRASEYFQISSRLDLAGTIPYDSI